MAKQAPQVEANDDFYDVEVPADYPIEYLQCRENHRWNRRALHDVVDLDHSERIRECADCGYRQVRTINIHTGEQVKLRYRNKPKGYAMPRSGLRSSQYRQRLFQLEFDEAFKTGQPEVVDMKKKRRKQAS